MNEQVSPYQAHSLVCLPGTDLCCATFFASSSSAMWRSAFCSASNVRRRTRLQIERTATDACITDQLAHGTWAIVSSE